MKNAVLAVCLATAVAAAPPVLRPAPDFHMTDPSGKSFDLSRYRGKVVVMQFLYTTCGHCQAAAQMLSRLQSELGPRGLQVIGIAFNPGSAQPGVVDEFVKTNHVNFPVGTSPMDPVLSYLGIPVVERFGVPQIVIVDRRGMIRAQSESQGTSQLTDESYLKPLLEELLKK